MKMPGDIVAKNQMNFQNTIAWYDANAQQYAAVTAWVTMDPQFGTKAS